MARVTLKVLASQVGVSSALVSRVLRDDPRGRVSDAKRQQIVDLAHRLGYRADHAGRSLRRRRSGLLALVVPDITNPFFAFLFRAVETAALAHGHSVILCNADNDANRIDRLMDILGDGRVDGWLLAMAPEAWSAALKDAEIPFVLVNRRSEMGDAPWVGPTDTQTGALGARHLLELGHRRIVYLTADLTIGSMADRLAGFQAAAAASGVAPRVEVMGAEMTRNDVRPIVKALLERSKASRPTAIFVSNRLFLDGTLAAIRAAGLRVPQDISVVGYNPFDEALCTGIIVPVTEIGRLATEWLIDRLAQADTAPISASLPVSFVDHGTTAPPAG